MVTWISNSKTLRVPGHASGWTHIGPVNQDKANYTPGVALLALVAASL
jgi:hypothetical protein